MTGRRFRKTWWGQKWVETLEAIDRDTNRLPRERRYANKGSVLEIPADSGEYSAEFFQNFLREHLPAVFRHKDQVNVKIEDTMFSMSQLA